MKCPHCQVEINPDFKEYYIGGYENEMFYSVFYMRCQNPKCKSPIITLGKSKQADRGTGMLYGSSITYQQIYPIGSNRAPAPVEVESKFAEDYNEACFVLPFSPKASAALSRRCLQNIIRLKEGIRERNLKTEIDKLIATNKLPSYISDNLEIIRGFGNIAAHGMEDQVSGEILDVEPNEAEFLLDVLELLFDLYFVQAAKAAKMKAALNQKLTSAGQKPIP
ncbi:DUF4145 domain-containing protein [Bacteroides neonati]|uniref:DUF4145 domain-containing protein n=1 Tax=Bacteroides neonati TaxID=1347393 RepID=UPI0004B18BB6|nr:DUF4145 domain-containing protein [Bacteroides neonati]